LDNLKLIKNMSIKEQVEAIVRKAIESNVNESIVLFKLPTKLILEIKDRCNIDLTGYSASINTSAIRHVLTIHGDAKKEKKKGQVAVTEADFLLIESFILDPDIVELSDDLNNRGLQILKFIKQFGG